MRSLPLALLLAVSVSFSFLGCSKDPESLVVSPILHPQSTSPIGPSEIVLCIDVSDSISSSELEAIVGGLSGCLSDPNLVPQDGNVSLAAVIYGDTTDAILGAAVPVTEESLQQTIVPALQSLLEDRRVPTDGADLGGGLDEALMILGTSAIPDLHVLVVGSGAADDVDGVQSSCLALDGAGVMMSAIAVGAGSSGVDLLQSCAEASGGYFGQADTDVGAACADALAYMLVVDLDLEPETAEKQRDEEHKVTARVFRGGDPEAYPVESQEVKFSVIAGPNAGESSTGTTDTTGTAEFSYIGDGGPGMDSIVAETLHPGTATALRDTVTVTWLNEAPECDAGGPYNFVVMGDMAQVTLDGSASSDADEDSLRYSWSADCAEASFDDPSAAMPVLTLTGSCLCSDSLTVELTVSDGFDETKCETVVYLEDQRPPVIEIREDPPILWPPNHKYRTITPDMVIASAKDACGNAIGLDAGVVLRIHSDELENGNGDGNTLHDILVECGEFVKLRAERAGGGNGRVYTIVFRYSTDNGMSSDVEAKVLVPHNSSEKTVGDDGVQYSVEPECNGES